MAGLRDHYRVLGVSRTASQRTIKRAYRVAALRDHPDNGGGGDRRAAEMRFRRVSEAYRVLSDPARRRAYDFRWQQYVAMVGPERFREEDRSPPPGRIWWDDRDGPGFYEAAARCRDEVRILTISCGVALGVCLGILVWVSESLAGNRGAGELTAGDVAVGVAAAWGLYLAVLAATSGILIGTRQVIRKILELRTAALLTRQPIDLPAPGRKSDGAGPA